MKARAVIFTHTQRPFTIFGLPPMLMSSAAFAAMLAWVICLILGYGNVAMLAMLASAIVTLAVCFYLARNDHHVESVFINTARFWGTNSQRTLLAGAAPSPRSKRKGGRK